MLKQKLTSFTRTSFVEAPSPPPLVRRVIVHVARALGTVARVLRVAAVEPIVAARGVLGRAVAGVHDGAPGGPAVQGAYQAEQHQQG